MTLFHVALIVATFLCSLVAGFLFAFAVGVMPGIRSLDDGEFIRAFRAIDGVIQRNQPLFMFMWVGSVLSLVAAALASVWTLARSVSSADDCRCSHRIFSACRRRRLA